MPRRFSSVSLPRQYNSLFQILSYESRSQTMNMILSFHFKVSTWQSGDLLYFTPICQSNWQKRKLALILSFPSKLIDMIGDLLWLSLLLQKYLPKLETFYYSLFSFQSTWQKTRDSLLWLCFPKYNTLTLYNFRNHYSPKVLDNAWCLEVTKQKHLQKSLFLTL